MDRSRAGCTRRSPFVCLSVLILASAAVDRASAQAPATEADSTRQPVQLEEIVVTASGFEQRRTNAPASVTVLSRGSIETQRNNNLAELLSTIEGIDVGDGVGKTGGPNISMRGMPSDYTLVLIDGRRQNSAGSVTPNGFGETSTSFLPATSAIERIEVIRGPAATLYGSDAMGRVINIITRRIGDRWRASLTSDATMQQKSGFGNTFSGNGSIDGPLVPGRLGIALRGSHLRRNSSDLTPTGEIGETTSISKRGPSPVEADISTFGGRLTFTPTPSHDLWIDAERARQSYDNSEGQLGTLDRPDASPPVFQGYGPEQRFLRDQATLAHTWRLGSGDLSSSLMRNTTETIGRTLPTGTPGGPPGSGAPNKPAGAHRTLETTNTVFDTKLNTMLGDHVATLGGQFWRAGMVDGVALEPFEFTQWSLFIEDEWRFIPSMALTAGARYDDHSTFGGQVSPRAYLVWNADRSWTLKGGVSRGYRTPRVEQLVDGIIGFSGQGTIALIGTPTLQPETSTSTEVGLYYHGVAGLSANVTLFNNDFRDKITRGTPVPNCSFELAPDLPGCLDYGNFPAQETFSQSINLDEAVTRGIEVSGTLPLRSWATLTTNYTFTESEQQSGDNIGMPLTNTPKHMVNGNLRSRLTERLDGWLRGEYRSKRARSITGGTNAAYEALGDYRAYALFHLGGGYDVGRGVTLNATVYNLLNKDFLEYAAYQGNPTASNPSGILYTSLYNNHQEGRRLWLSTTFTF